MRTISSIVEKKEIEIENGYYFDGNSIYLFIDDNGMVEIDLFNDLTIIKSIETNIMDHYDFDKIKKSKKITKGIFDNAYIMALERFSGRIK